MNPYASEAQLVDQLVDHLRYVSTTTQAFATEFNYQRGRADLILRDVDGKVVAFEAKLTRWRDALHQAYRNQCFANASYVVLPKTVALNAAAFTHEFQRRNVGLCYLDGDKLVVVHAAAEVTPLQAWLAHAAHAHITSNCA